MLYHSTKLWEMPECTGINRLPARSTLHPYPDADAARQGNWQDSPYVQSLTGTWQFRLEQRVEDAPADFAAPDYPDQEWDGIEVPGHWTMQGYDAPQYVSVRMPFPNTPPSVPEENPTGLYRRTFALPESWENRRIVLHFDGVETAFYVYVNGKEVGFSKDSRVAAEFDITSFVQSGENVLALKVIKWSDGSFIENQDYWRFAGIYRRVYLYATEATYIQDVFARGDLDEDLVNGNLQLVSTLGFHQEPQQAYRLKVELFDADGKLLISEQDRLGS